MTPASGITKERQSPLSCCRIFGKLWWFVAAVGTALLLAVAAGVWLDARRRMHRQLQRLEKEQAIERERTRIAQDIHDDLGASLTRITMLSQSARSELDQSPQAAAQVDQICSTARELTRSMDEIVWAVNPRHDSLDSLAVYLGKFAQDYLRAAGIRCRLDMDDELPSWPLTAETRHNSSSPSRRRCTMLSNIRMGARSGSPCRWEAMPLF